MATAAVVPIPEPSKRERVITLVVVLFVSLSTFFVGSLLVWLGAIPTQRNSTQIWMGVLQELSGLILLCFVLWKRGTGAKSIGLQFDWRAIPFSLWLFAGGIAGYYIFGMVLSVLHMAATGKPAPFAEVDSIFELSVGLIFYMCLSPVFEELIVRAFMMTELFAITGGWVVPAIASAALQASYHLYQGTWNALTTLGIFAVFAIYFAKTRRAADVVLAHLWMDMFALARRL